jgi:gamma-glutamylcyclotransferase (GGCT)/AIG2-like uncharacterized protein YtfP
VAPGVDRRLVYVFVYGTLTDPARVAQVLEEFSFVGPAVLDGLHVVRGTYPTLVPGGETEGRLLEIDPDDVGRLDDYEGVDSGLYVRVAVPVEGDASGEATVYVGDPDRLGIEGSSWPETGPFEERVRTTLAERDVVVRLQHG